MCGITGILNTDRLQKADDSILLSMAQTLAHRGPDDMACYTDDNLGLGFRRLSIIDLANGQQPFYNDDHSISVICNGEIYNYKELRSYLQQKGYIFKTTCDIEVLLPLYLEHGVEFLKQLNGQFAIAIYDKRQQTLLLARDQLGICPLFYSLTEGAFLFGSEIKALLKHPLVKREPDLTGLDQVFSFPGLVSPHTMFKNISSLKPGHYLLVKNGQVNVQEYWDLDYPVDSHCYEEHPESYYVEKLEELLLRSVNYRLNADVPVGFYLSGGLDSSLLGAMMKKLNPSSTYPSFSICFPDPENRDIDESNYQQLVATHIQSKYNRIPFTWKEIDQRMRDMIYYAECPLKETYNTCSLALSGAARQNGIKVILSGEGADELFGGYVGYRFDVQRKNNHQQKDLEDLLEEQERKFLWGDPDFFYEKNYHEFSATKQSLYSAAVNREYNRFNAHRNLQINKDRLHGRSKLHKRSYLDIKLRLSDHLLADHCDRTCYANSIEGRYPFLDINLVEFVKGMPPHLKLNQLVEKYILKKVGSRYLPEPVFTRQKQGFTAPGSPYLLQNKIEWVQDMLSYERIKRQNYFNADVVENIRKLYSKESFRLNLPFDSDLLIIVLTFNLFLDIFNCPDYQN